jgi:uncharacterized protein
MNEVTNEKIEKYLNITKTALSRIKIAKDLSKENQKYADEFLDMASRYHKDGMHYKEKGDVVTAFAAVNYAHGWIDAGARIGLFEVEKDSEDFVMPRE